MAASPILGLLRQRLAATAIEYALIAAIMTMVIITGIALFGGNFDGTMTHVTNTLSGTAAKAAAQTSALPSGSSQKNPGQTSPGQNGTTASSPAGPTLQVNTANPASPTQ